jgi:hypothetical protein
MRTKKINIKNTLVFLASLLGILLIMVSAAYLASNRNRSNLSSKASYYGSVTFMATPLDSVITVGQATSVKVSINSGTNKVGAVTFQVSYNPSFLQFESISAGPEFNTVLTPSITPKTVSAMEHTLTFTELIKSPYPAITPYPYPNGLVDTATIVFRPLRSGTTTINVIGLDVAGYNPGSTDKNLGPTPGSSQMVISSGITPTAVVSISISPTATASSVPTQTPTLTPALIQSPTPTRTQTPTPTRTPTPSRTPTPTSTSSCTPIGNACTSKTICCSGASCFGGICRIFSVQ